MEHKLYEMIDFYKERQDYLAKSVQECLAMKDYLSAHHFRKERAFIRHKIETLESFENSFSREIHILKRQINLLKRWRNDALSTYEEEIYSPAYFESEARKLAEHYRKMEVWESEGFESARGIFKVQTHFLNKYLDQLQTKEAKELSIHWEDNDEAKINIKKSEAECLLIEVKGEKYHRDHLAYPLEKSPDMHAMGFVEKNNQMELLFSHKTNDWKLQLREICARLVYDVFRELTSWKSIYLQIRL
ncbi:MAG: hypothetical protein AAF696_07935 [Bacteroidota bacterium]